MHETRSIWIRTLNGVPQDFVWASVKLQADATTNQPMWECALRTADHPTASGWDATPTLWRDISPLCFEDSLAVGSSLSGRTLTVGGCTFNLDVGGRAKVSGGYLPPDATVGTAEALVAHIEALGHDVAFIEKGTLKRCRVYTTEPGDPLAGGAVDSAFYRQTSDSQAVRVDG